MAARMGNGLGQRPKEPLGPRSAGLATVPLARPCRARVVSWARSAAHELHWPSDPAAWARCLSCRTAHGPCRRPMGRLEIYDSNSLLFKF
jgi:hypothetical protein